MNKKLLIITFISLLFLSTLISFLTKRNNSNWDIDTLVKPYIDVIEKLNIEYDDTMQLIVPLEEFYNNISNMTPLEFENLTRHQLETLPKANKITIDTRTGKITEEYIEE